MIFVQNLSCSATYGYARVNTQQEMLAMAADKICIAIQSWIKFNCRKVKRWCSTQPSTDHSRLRYLIRLYSCLRGSYCRGTPMLGLSSSLRYGFVNAWPCSSLRGKCGMWGQLVGSTWNKLALTIWLPNNIFCNCHLAPNKIFGFSPLAPNKIISFSLLALNKM